jgi:Putative transposase/Transposase zinc-binding domain
MPRPAFELADIFRRFGHAFVAAHALSRAGLRVMRAIEVCRTAVLGGHVEQCGHCSHSRIAYNSCRNRHCPKCQNTERAQWVEERKAELLPVPYFHVVFTLPAEVARIAYYNPRQLYGMLFRVASETLLTIARDPQHLGAEIGFFAILHTWGQNLLHHPHVHCVVPGGGLSPDGERWICCRPGFFLPVRVLSRLFRRLFLEALQTAFDQGRLRFFGELLELRHRERFTAYLAPLADKDWVVYAKPPFGGAAQTLEYLGRYTHRVALSNDRILAIGEGGVTFQWKDYRGSGKTKSRRMTLDAGEFIRRFLIHVLPDRFQRIRHCGFLANRHRKRKLELCRRLLKSPIDELLPDREQCAAVLAGLAPTASRCPFCGVGEMIRVADVPAYCWPAQPPNTS